MIYWNLFWGFLKVGLFSFGGAYAAIPLIRDVVLSYGWIDDEMMTYMIAVSESTPGPIMINLATYVGSSQAGILGSLAATTAVVLPSFFIIMMITAILKKVIDHPCVQALLRGLKPCIIGIILSIGAYMILEHVTGAEGNTIDTKALLITAALAMIYWGSRRWKLTQKGITPIQLIVVSAVMGVIIYGI